MILVLSVAAMALAPDAPRANAQQLLYRADTGVARTGRIYNDGTFDQFYDYEFSTGWTHIVRQIGAQQVLIYNADTGLAVTVSLTGDGIFTQYDTYGFDAGWTHIAADF